MADRYLPGLLYGDGRGCDCPDPEASYAERGRIWKEHLDYTLGLLYFMWTDPRIPERIRHDLARWGWPKDEYPESGHITPQLYVRESRRMLGRMVMTQNHCEGRIIEPDTIALADYTIIQTLIINDQHLGG